jgi:hypothetical protein
MLFLLVRENTAAGLGNVFVLQTMDKCFQNVGGVFTQSTQVSLEPGFFQ